jgi:hypothetical protein
MAANQYDLIILSRLRNQREELKMLAHAPDPARVFQADHFAGPQDLLSTVKAFLKFVSGKASDA